jgi:pentatricopeptide repeat protein
LQLLICARQLLLEAYGTIHPIQLDATWSIFNQLTRDRKARVNGSHWAAIINAYGCAQKDLAGALDVFDTIKKHKSTAANQSSLPDALVYEALFNVLVTHHRPDLFDRYLLRMRKDNIHMTAYIANLLIKGHAATGNIEEARSMFESLSDPPVGVDAPDNHPPHPKSEDVSAALRHVSPSAPVYREVRVLRSVLVHELTSPT